MASVCISSNNRYLDFVKWLSDALTQNGHEVLGWKTEQQAPADIFVLFWDNATDEDRAFIDYAIQHQKRLILFVSDPVQLPSDLQNLPFFEDIENLLADLLKALQQITRRRRTATRLLERDKSLEDILDHETSNEPAPTVKREATRPSRRSTATDNLSEDTFERQPHRRRARQPAESEATAADELRRKRENAPRRSRQAESDHLKRYGPRVQKQKRKEEHQLDDEMQKEIKITLTSEGEIRLDLSPEALSHLNEDTLESIKKVIQNIRQSTAEQLPEFSAYYPGAVKPGETYELMLFAHLAQARNEIQQFVMDHAIMMGEQKASSTTASRIKVAVGSLITFVPYIKGIEFSPTEQLVEWKPPFQNVTFLFRTPATLDAELTGNVRVFHGPLVVGEIPISMRLATRTSGIPKIDQESTFSRFDPVFASYSHRDRPVMEYFRLIRQKVGQKMLVDIYDLRAGEHWSERLLQMIDESAAFQLFWSKNSAQSSYCRQEWEYALKLMQERPRFVQPVYWQDPIPPQPSELAKLHFQRVVLPVMTRMQLTWGEVKKIFAKK
ncbi:MAG TPA: toll/interleukin-1 receptor domain-containing protein [Aggregatilineaceae bacterium]|nr:toll/interleukin-1 receptor domain-containing protein [Aggregatilineaceae bacterium]